MKKGQVEVLPADADRVVEACTALWVAIEDACEHLNAADTVAVLVWLGDECDTLRKQLPAPTPTRAAVQRLLWTPTKGQDLTKSLFPL